MLTDAQQERLRTDYAYYTREFVKIEGGPGGEAQPLIPRPGQVKLEQAVMEARAEGRPIRVIICKARQIGFSTIIQGYIVQRVTQNRNHNALTVAHLKETAEELAGRAFYIYSQLPNYPWIKPNITTDRKGKNGYEIGFGAETKQLARAGHVGLNSGWKIDSAQNIAGGRGLTKQTVHLSEAAFYPSEKKMTSVINSVADDDPDSAVFIESTADGFNFFYDRWINAIEGRSVYVPIFASWWEEPKYAWKWTYEGEREEFIESVQKQDSPYAEDEPRLLEMGVSYEHLRWRRFAIPDKCEDDVETFNVEYPSTWQDAFIGSGRTVYSRKLIKSVIGETRKSDPAFGMTTEENPGPKEGILIPGGEETLPTTLGTINAPTSAIWVPRSATDFNEKHHFTRIFEDPDPAKQYMIGADVADVENPDNKDASDHAFSVRAHVTLEQVATWHGKIDADNYAQLLFLAGIHFNWATISVEMTGGHGLPILKRLSDMQYPYLYERTHADADVHERPQAEKVGWDTNRATKPLMEAHYKELMRDKPELIRCRRTADQLMHYVIKPNGQHGPEGNKHVDMVLADMICVASANDMFPRDEIADNDGSAAEYGSEFDDEGSYDPHGGGTYG